MDQDIEIVICTEKGPLEQMSMLLVSSIRQFGGKYRNAPIYSYQPRSECKISDETIRFFEKNNVHYIDEPLNTKYTHYPLANKPLACAHREIRTRAKFLVFLDSDTCFLGEPFALDMLSEADAAINPTDLPNIATDINFSTGEAEYWKKIYDELQIERRRELQTTVTNEKILEYYNSGFIVNKTSTGLYSSWLKNFEHIMSKGIHPTEGIFFIEQSVFSATVAQLGLNVNPLGKTLNFPVTTYTKKWRGYYPFSLKEVKHMHYHKIFNKKTHAKRLTGKIATIENGAIVNKLISDYFIVVNEEAVKK